MVWDLRAALLAKEERESARLADFDFRLRVRTLRLLAPMLGMEAEPLCVRAAAAADAPLFAALAEETGISPATLAAHADRARAEARVQLLAERGDPTPQRLA